MNGGTAIVPNLDSIDEFRLLTNNFDPEYGNYNGGIVNVVTKSGSDTFHGNVFEFFRNTSLDARNYFSPERADVQAEPAGRHGRRPDQEGQDLLLRRLPGHADDAGHRDGQYPGAVDCRAQRVISPDVADQLTGTVNGSVLGEPAVAATRLRRVGGRAVLHCRAARPRAQCVLSERDDSRVARGRRRRSSCCSTCPRRTPGRARFRPARSRKPCATTRGRSGVDGNSPLGLLSGYYFLDDYRLDNPYPAQQGGANVPGFDALTLGRAQLWSLRQRQDARLGDTVNDFHVSLTAQRQQRRARRSGGLGVTLASQGFVTGPGTPGIVVLAPQFEGVENLVFNTFTMGVTITGVNQTGDTLHLERQRVEGDRVAHAVKLAASSVRSRSDSSPTRRSTAPSRSPARKPDPISPTSCSACRATTSSPPAASFYLRNQIRRRVRAGQLARAIEPDAELRAALGSSWRRGTSKYNQIQTFVAGAAVRRSIPVRRWASSFPATRASRGRCRRRAAVSPPLACRSPSFDHGVLKRYSAERRRPASARATACSTRRSRACRPASCTASRRTATTTSAPRRRSSPRRSSPPLTAPTTASGFRSTFRAAQCVAEQSVNTIDWSQFLPVNADPYFCHDNKTSRTPTTSWCRSSGSWPPTWSLTASYVGNHAATTCSCCSRPTPAIRRCA